MIENIAKGPNQLVHALCSVFAAMQVRWIFFDGAQFEILSFVVNETLPDKYWQAPNYCFSDEVDRQLSPSIA